MQFFDRAEAGGQLADRMQNESLVDPVVLGLPRGGVPVAFEVATRLGAPLDVFVARKIGVPSQPELGMGAVAEGGTVVLTQHLITALGISEERLRELTARAHEELERRVRHYRGDRQLLPLEGRDVVLIDDGLATGVTAEASLRALLELRPRRLVLAVPVCSQESASRLGELAEVVCLVTSSHFGAVGVWYDVFDQTADDTVLALLDRARSVGPPKGR
jgi:predicted phosphoribosyltransferase